MMIFAIRIEHAPDVPVQCPHDADASKHRRAAVLCDQEQHFDRGLPFLELLFGLW
jgi:hypothetical protein